MAATPHPWSLKGITPAAREAAKQAAQADGVTLGVWLTRLIREIAAEQGVTEADIAADPAPAAVRVEAPPAEPSRPSSIERLMQRHNGIPAESVS